MKKTAILLATLGLGFSALSAQTVPEFLNYQGTVTDSAGLGLGDSPPVNRKVLFRVYDTATGNNLIWTEEQTVTISKGQFSVLLGQGIQFASEPHDSLLDVFGNGPTGRYLAITVDNGDGMLNASDLPITPRQRITSTAYSFRAGTADSIASGSSLQLNTTDSGLGYFDAGRTFGGFNISGPVLYGAGGGALGVDNGGGGQTTALRWNSSNQVGIGSADLSGAAGSTKLVLQGDDNNTAPRQLNIRGNTDTNKRLLLGYNTTSNYGSLQAYSGAAAATNLILSPSGGNVGIGTTSTPSKLTIASVGNDYGLTIAGASVSPGLTLRNDNPGGQTFSMFVGSTEPGSVQGLSIFDGSAFAYRFVIRADGNVGIGTTSPTNKLQVSGNAAFSGNVGIGTTTPDVKLEVIGPAKIGRGISSGRAIKP